MARKILVTGGDLRPELLQPLSAAGFETEHTTRALSESELAEAMATACAMVLGGSQYVWGSALARAPELKVIAFVGMGYETYIDVAAAKARGVAVTNTPGTLNNAVADLTVGLILCAVRRIHLSASQFESGTFVEEPKQRDLAALQVGIVGMGGCGARIADVLRHGFGARVSYFSRTRKPDLEAQLSITYRPLDDLAASSDVLVAMTPGNAETTGLIGKALLGRAKPGLILVNTSRPGVVDPQALLDGLTSGKIAYAAFDGFYKEPPALAAALKALMPEKLMVTRHIGSLTHDARDAMVKNAVKSVLNMLATGDDPARVV
jgi:lactate dehydrogenase-like 2-hydroxyacid dehydrogenase